MLPFTLLTLMMVLESAHPKMTTPTQKTLPQEATLDSTDPLAVLESRLPLLRTDWVRKEAGVYYVHNNVWNKAGVSRYRQGVGIKALSDGGVEAGWAWQWPETQRAMSFPEVAVGKNPWAGKSTHPDLPVQCRDLKSLAVELDLAHEGWGTRGTAIQIWFTHDSLGGSDRISRELMIWVANDGIPVKGWMADLSIDGASYTLADDPDLGRALKWPFHSFFRTARLDKGRLDLLPFFDYLAGKGLMDKKEWIASIHLGTEVRGGSGLTRVNRFRLDLAR